MSTPTARIARLRPRRSSGDAACEAAFISARAAVTRYRKRSRKQTARRARFGLVSSTCSVLSKPRREVGLYGPSASCGAKAKIGLQNLAYNIRRLVTLERLAAA